MWRKEEQKAPGATEAVVPANAGTPTTSTSSSGSASASPAELPISPRAAACITPGIRIKGDISGKEDLFVDGTLDGKLDLGNASCTVGPHGKVKADISAREVIVRGQIDGKVEGREKVQLWNTGRVVGEVRTERLAIEDGAVLRGKVEAGKPVGGAAESRGKNATATSEKPKSANAEASSRAAVI